MYSQPRRSPPVIHSSTCASVLVDLIPLKAGLCDCKQLVDTIKLYMPLIVISGQPSSGKSTVAAKLSQLLQPGHPVHIVDEPSLHLHRNSAYQSALLHALTLC